MPSVASVREQSLGSRYRRRVKVICLPNVEAEQLVQPLPDNVRTVVWDGTGAPPDERIEFLVPGYSIGRARPLPDLPDLKVVQLLSAGLNGWQDVLPESIILCNGRGIHGASTAELALTGLLAVLRDLPYFLEQQKAGRWQPRQTVDLDQRAVLIIGAGDIGSHLKAAVEVFGAQVTMVGRTAREGVRVLADLPALLP
jgi:lactate dehydrogenase-like 2-hydroxyacid dehydrogenase